MGNTVKVYDKFEYFLDDTDCMYCLYWRGKRRGCSLTACCCDDIKLDALAHGRIQREKGWNKNAGSD